MRILRVRSPSIAANFITSPSVKHPVATALAGAAGLLAAFAFANWRLAKRAQRANPPQGQFIEIDGVRLHYVERGTGKPLVLLHGNGSMIQDFESAGLIDLAARHYRVIVFDRPGFGHSSRPRSVIWGGGPGRLVHAGASPSRCPTGDYLGAFMGGVGRARSGHQAPAYGSSADLAFWILFSDCAC